MKTGYLRRDESSHWYLIPKKEIESFDKSQREEEKLEVYSEDWYHHIDVFEETFGKYRIDGGVRHLEVIMPEIENRRNETSEPTNY